MCMPGKKTFRTGKVDKTLDLHLNSLFSLGSIILWRVGLHNNNIPCWIRLKTHNITIPSQCLEPQKYRLYAGKSERTSTFESFLCSVWVILVLIRMYQNGELYTERKNIQMWMGISSISEMSVVHFVQPSQGVC